MTAGSSGGPLTDIEVDDARRRTPMAEGLVHLNHAGASPSPQRVLDVQIDHLRREVETGGYEAAAEAEEADRRVYNSIAALIGCSAREIARAEHATSAWNAGFWSVPMQPGQRILTAEAAYGANAVAFLHAVATRQVRIDVVPSDASGQVDVAELGRRLDDDVALVAITHVPTNGGLVNPAADIGALTRAAGVPYLLDACQSVGQIPLDVEMIGCDLLSTTGRKYLRGPRGTGFLYARDSLVDRLVPSQPDFFGAVWDRPDGFAVEPHARRFEYWEYNHAAWLGLGEAVELAREIGVDRIEATVTRVAETLRSALGNVGLPVYDLGRVRCGIVTTHVDGHDPFDVRDTLRSQNINISVSTADGTLWDFERRALPPLLRLSVHYLTTADDIDRAVTALTELR